MATPRKRRYDSAAVIHPVLLALYPVLGLYAHNADKTPVDALLRPCAVFAGLALCLWLILWPIVRNRYKAGFAASVLVVGCLSGWNVLEQTIAGVPEQAIWWLIGIYLVFLGVVVAFVLHYEGDSLRITRAANWFGLILVLLSLANILVHRPIPRTSLPPAAPFEAAGNTAVQNSGDKQWPDIYFIVLRGYARSDVLSAMYGYNNLPLIESIAEKGFTCASESTVNYPSTLLSLTSCLNMDYLQDLIPRPALDSEDLRDVVDLYHNNRVYDFLKRQGYTLTVFSPGIELLEPRANVDMRLRSRVALGEFEMVLLNTTAFARLIEAARYLRGKPLGDWRHVFDRKRFFYTFDALAELAKEPSDTPRFIFVYFRIPEPPFVFRRDGKSTTSERAPSHIAREMFRGTRQEYKKLYVDQLHFTSRLLQNTLNAIVDKATRPPVILVVSDHGPGAEYNPEDIAVTNANERFANLTLTYFPEDQLARPIEVDESLSLVNLFRITLNGVFGLTIPAKADMAYFSAASRPLDFQTVVLANPNE